MASLAEDEIGAQMENIKQEWKEAVTAAQDNSAAPVGVSRAELQKWKAEQAAAAKKRLDELEERLQRLQALKSKLKSLKAQADETLQAAPEGWNIPNTVISDKTDRMSAYDSHFAASGMHGNCATVPLYAAGHMPPPLTPGLSAIRNIVRDEMTEVVTKLGIDGRPLKHNDTLDEHGHGQEKMERVVSFGNVDDPDKHLAGKKALQNLNRMHGSVEDDDEDNVHAEHDAGAKRIRTLDDAIPVSVPMFFGGFSRRSPVRMKCLMIYNSHGWQIFFVLVTILNSIILAIAPELATNGTGNNHTPSALEIIDYACVGVLTFEILVGIIALGFFSGETTWLRISDMHALEFAVFVLIIVEYVCAAFGVDSTVTLVPFRLLRILKVLISLRFFGGIKAIIASLRQGIMQLMIVFSMLLFFLAALGILGMAILSKSFRRRCVVAYHNVSTCASDFSTGWAPRCNFTNFSQTEELSYDNAYSDQGFVGKVITGGWPFERWCKIVYNTTAGEYDDEYPIDHLGRYHTCQLDAFREGGNAAVNQMCEELENPSYTFSHFDHMGGALLSLSQGTVADSYYDIIWRSIESEPDVAPILWIFYFFISCLCTWLMLGLFVAVVTGTFKRVREQHGTAFRSQEGDDSMKTLHLPVLSQLGGMHIFRSFHASRGYLGKGAVHPADPEEAKKRHAEQFVDDKPLRVKEARNGDEVIVVWARTLILHPRFFQFIALTMICHIFAMISDQHDTDAGWKEYVRIAYLVCNLIFVAELIVRFVAAGTFELFWLRKFNRFEIVVCTVGVLGLATGNRLLLLLPAIRLYRLMRYVPTLEDLLLSAIGSAHAVLNLIIFIAIVGLAFIVTGRYVFGTRMDDITRSNFGTFQMASLTIFQLLTGDSWSSVLYAAMHSMDGVGSQLFAALFILSWFCFCALVVNNLFVAVIIENFEVAETIASIERPGHLSAFRAKLRETFGSVWKRRALVQNGDLVLDTNTGELHHPTHGHQATTTPGLEQMHEHSGKSTMMEVVRSAALDYDEDTVEEEEDVEERVLYFFQPWSSVRRAFMWLDSQPAFEFLVFAAIICSCIFLIVTPPADDVPGYEPVLSKGKLDQANTVFTFVFCVEFVVRVMDRGLLFTQKAYLKSGWNCMDFIVLVFSLVDQSGSLQQGQYAKILRLTRALRPLRLMKRNQGMRVVIDALVSTLAPVGYVIIFSIFTFVVFGVIGMGLFGGLFFRCSTPGAEYPGGKLECSGHHVTEDGLLMQRAWYNPEYNFDKFVDAFMTLFRVNTIKYVAIGFDAMDLTDYDQSPKENHSQINSLFFVVYLIVGALFVMNLFVGFIVDGFNANKGSTDEDLLYNRFVRQLQIAKPKYKVFREPQNSVSESARKLINHRRFQIFSGACVFLNVCMMLADHADSTEAFQRMIDQQNLVFFVELWMEVLLNLAGYGPGGFWDDPWRGFDLFVAMGSAAGYLAGSSSSNLGNFTRSFRLLRIVRLMKMIRPIRIILETLIASISQLANILLLLFLVYSMFAVVAVQLFGNTKFGRRLGPTANFQDYGFAMATIYQIVTGDEWFDLMYDCEVAPPSCTLLFSSDYDPYYTGPTYSFGDCGSSAARYFFIAFKVVCENVMLNLFIGMILDNFSFITDEVGMVEDEEWTSGASASQIEDMTKVFQRFDNKKSYIPISVLHSLLCEMKQPLGFRNQDGKLEYGHWERACELLIRAELNVIVRHQLNLAEEKRMSMFQRLLPNSKSISLSEKVQYEDVMKTILYWRKPNMVPYLVKKSRRKRVEEVILIGYALVILDAMLEAVAYKKRMRVLKHLSARKEFKEWETRDPIRIRRFEALQEEWQMHREKAARESRSVLSLHALQSRGCVVELEAVDECPEDVVLHQTAAQAVSRLLKPMHGIEAFRQWLKSHLVVAKFIDPRHAHRGHVLIDFKRAGWDGWVVVNLQFDTMFRPETLRTRLEEEGKRGWERVEVVMKAGKSIANRGRLVKMGTVQDVHGYLVTHGHDKVERVKNAQSRVRLNLGPGKVEEMVARSRGGAVREDGEEVEEDSVLEIIGYVPAVGRNAARRKPRSDDANLSSKELTSFDAVSEDMALRDYNAGEDEPDRKSVV